ncbi:hypothetical protein [Archangium violaceum]|uniref:hypothetical protein n=1 Tax=Archangium violaceum TaxID=83451 RepID=UPI003D2BB42B
MTLAHVDGTAVVGAGADAVTPTLDMMEVAVKGMAVGLGQPGARSQGAAEVRWRLLGGHLYVLGQGGTLLFPRGQGALRPGAFASVGLGVEHAR